MKTYLATSSDDALAVWSIYNTTTLNMSPEVEKVYQNEFESSNMNVLWHPRYPRLACLNSDPSGKLCFLSFDSSVDSISRSTTCIPDNRPDKSVATCVSFSQRSGRDVALGFEDGFVKVYSLRETSCIQSHESASFRLPRGVSVVSLTWAATDYVIVAGCNYGTVYVALSDGSQKDASPLSHKVASRDTCLALCTSPVDSTKVLAGYACGKLAMWNICYPLHPDSVECILFQIPDMRAPSFTLSIGIALSPCDLSVIVSSGAPDLHLRVWSLDANNTTQRISHTCSPADEDSGYLSCDINPTGTILATGLMSGRALLYDFHRFPMVIHSIVVFDNCPISTISFAMSIESRSEVHFLKSPENIIPTELDTITEERSGTIVRSALGDLTNTAISWPSHHELNIFDGISILGLSDSSDNTGLKSLPHPTYQENKENLCEVSCMSKQPISQDASNSSEFATCPSPKPKIELGKIASNDELGEVKALLHSIHSDVVGHIERLDEKVDSVLDHLSNRLLELQRGYNSLRLELERRSYFY